ncbi:MAG: trypsin-like serine protease [Proteobacteria bacterium]|nr:MAG: trypsin-like serine protease [Pseudomonadota bacterium]
MGRKTRQSLRFLLLYVLVQGLWACGRELSSPRSALTILGGFKSEDIRLQSTLALQNASDGEIFCSGTLIHPELIVTSAHCLAGKKPAEIKVRMARGEVYGVGAMQSYKAEQKFGVNFDIAWIRLEQPVAGYEPVEILRSAEALTGNKSVTAAGYGQRQSHCPKGEVSCTSGELLQSPVLIEEYVNRGRWFHLVLTRAEPGQGPCLGDSGGPLYLTIGDKPFLAGNFVGWDQRLVTEDKAAICERGEAIYNGTGAYRSWIEATSGLSLPLTESLNPPAKPESNPIVVRDATRFEDWCESRDEKDSSWYTVQRLISLAGDYASENGGDMRRVFTDCAYAKETLESKIKLDRGLILDAFAPESFGSEAQITDLRPFMALRTMPISKLVLSGHAISDFTLVGVLPKLKDLEITGNHGEVLGPLNVSAPFALSRLSVKNSPKAVQLDTISAIPNLRILELENVRGETKDVLSLPPSLTQLKVKADISVELPDFMPSLQSLELSGLKSIRLGSRYPRLVKFSMAESANAVSANRLVTLAEAPLLEEFVFQKNSNVASISFPAEVSQLKSIEIVASQVRALGNLNSASKLTKANFSNNQLDLMPHITNAPLLDTLTLSDNPMTPDSSISALTGLKTLRAEHLNHGRWDDLSMIDLPQLTELRVARNSFRQAKEFLRFPNLAVLVISENKFEDISSLERLFSLSYLEAVDNPLFEPRCPLSEERYCRFEWAN